MKLKLPIATFLNAIEEKNVYYFSSKRINTNIPHNYICLKRTDSDLLILSCCTSKFDTVKRFIEIRNLPFETLVWIKPDNDIFDRETYINCNQYFTFTVEQFAEMYKNEVLEYKGKISDNHFEQIINGLIISPLIDEETKELLPTI